MIFNLSIDKLILYGPILTFIGQIIIALVAIIIAIWGDKMKTWPGSIYQILKNYSEKRDQNKLAKFYFSQFKNLVIRFDFAEYKDDNIQKVIQNLKEHTETDKIMQFTKLYIPDTDLIQDRYILFLSRLDRFDGTKDNLAILVREFESIQRMYFKIYVELLTNQITAADLIEKIPKCYKEYYSNARYKYISYMMDYVKFSKEANGAFKNHIFKDNFDRPREL